LIGNLLSMILVRLGLSLFLGTRLPGRIGQGITLLRLRGNARCNEQE
jgi:hypothetical protein